MAVKALRPELAGDPAAAELRAEALVTSRLEHSNIPPVYPFGHDETGTSWLATKVVKGIEWAKLIAPTDEERGRAAAVDLHGHLEILRRVCDVVALAHSRGVNHRDLDPENVMVGEVGEVLLTDRGIAWDLSNRPPPAMGLRRPVGTPAHLAPETVACRDRDIGPATDVRHRPPSPATRNPPNPAFSHWPAPC